MKYLWQTIYISTIKKFDMWLHIVLQSASDEDFIII